MQIQGNVFKKIQESYKKFVSRKGVIEFTAGEYELFIHVKIRSHEKVRFRYEEVSYSTCSYLPENTFTILSQKEDGFLVEAKVESEVVKFFWHVK